MILAIDGGTQKCGLSILSYENRITKLIDSHQLFLKENSLEKRLYFFETFLREYIEEYSPKEIALEETFIAPPKIDPKTKKLKYPYCKESPLALSLARGIVFSSAGKYSLTVYQYLPTVVKKTVTGNAQATKKMIMRQMFNTFGKEFQEDEADSIAVGITHLCLREK